MSPHTDEVTALLVRSGALKTGHFVLSSGLHSDRYCQCAALFEHPDMAARVATLMAALIPRDARPTVVLAPALGGVVWGYELARALGARSLFAEREGANRTFALRRGFRIGAQDRVLLAEDVITTGGSVLEVVPLAEAAGATIVGVASVVDRSRGAAQTTLGARWPVWSLVELDFPTYPADALPPDLAAIPVQKPGSRTVG
jgi:orotate phosphoribosyltransferase